MYMCRPLLVGDAMSEVVDNVINKMSLGVSLQLIELCLGVYTVNHIDQTKIHQHLTTRSTNVIHANENWNKLLGEGSSGLGSANSEKLRCCPATDQW